MRNKFTITFLIILLFLVSVILILSVYVPTTGYPGAFHLSKSGMHFTDTNEGDFHEWWFGIFYDKEEGIGGLFEFNLREHKTGDKMIVNFIGFDKLTDSAFEIIELKDVAISKGKANINYNGNSYEILDEKSARLNLSLKNSRIELLFQRGASGFILEEGNAHIGVPVLNGKVSGSLVNEKGSHDIDGFGYLEHAFGKGNNYGWAWGMTGDKLNDLGIFILRFKLDEEYFGGLVFTNKDGVTGYVPVQYLNISETRENKTRIYAKDNVFLVDIQTECVSYKDGIPKYCTFTGNVLKNGITLISLDNEPGFFEFKKSFLL